MRLSFICLFSSLFINILCVCYECYRVLSQDTFYITFSFSGHQSIKMEFEFQLLFCKYFLILSVKIIHPFTFTIRSFFNCRDTIPVYVYELMYSSIFVHLVIHALMFIFIQLIHLSSFCQVFYVSPSGIVNTWKLVFVQIN